MHRRKITGFFSLEILILSYVPMILDEAAAHVYPDQMGGEEPLLFCLDIPCS